MEKYLSYMLPGKFAGYYTTDSVSTPALFYEFAFFLLSIKGFILFTVTMIGTDNIPNYQLKYINNNRK